MAYSTNMDDEHLRRLHQMMARDGSIKQKIMTDIEREAINDYRDSYQAPSARSESNTSYISKFRDPDLRIQTLTDKNEELTDKYALLLQKTNTIVDAYRKLDAENKVFKIKKDKHESWENNVSVLKKYLKDTLEKIILWFSS